MLSARAGRGLAIIGAAVLCGLSTARAAEDLDREFEFASGLVSLGFADYAERLVDEIIRLNPGQKDRASMVQAEALTARRKFDEAEALLAKMPPTSPKAQAAKLAMANVMYRMREIDRAKKHYDEYFKQFKDAVPTDPDLKRFYMDSAFRYGQMLEQSGDLKGAADAYERVIKCKPEGGIVRRMQSDVANILVKVARTNPATQEPLLARAWKMCEAIQWGKEGIDVPFVNSIVTMANIEIARGKPDAARKLIKNNIDLMSGVDEILKEEGQPLSLSPLAGVRFLLGELNEKEGNRLAGSDKKKAGEHYIEAVTHYINVFVKYGDSDWGPDAGSRAEALKAKIKEFTGKEVKFDMGKHAATAIGSLSRMADSMFLQKKFDESAKSYLRILNMFPDSSGTGKQFTNLLLSYANLNNKMYFETTADYIAERMRRDPDAGLSLLVAAKYYFDKKDETTCIRLYETFVRGFPTHEKAPAVLYQLAAMLKKKGDESGHQKYLDLITKNFKQDQYYLKALSMIAWAKYQAKDYKGAQAQFTQYVQDSVPSHQRGTVQFSLADCFARLQDYAGAVREYRLLRGWLAPKDQNPYGTTAEEVKRNGEMLEKTDFFIGYNLTRLMEPKEAIPQIRQAAIQSLNQYIKDYPKSELASKAMYLVGATQLEQGDTAGASSTFESLAKTYPESEDGRNARFSLIKAANEIKKPEIAQQAFDRMMADEQPGVASKTYTPEQWVRIGQIFFDAGSDSNAVRAFERVQAAKSEDRAVLERTFYGMGIASFRLKSFEVAIKNLEDMMLKYPKSGLFFEAKLNLARAYRETGKLNDASLALSDIFKFAEDPLISATANIEFAQVQTELAKTLKGADADDARKAALASYERIGMFVDEKKDARLAPLVETAHIEAVKLYEGMGKIVDAIAVCDRYMEKFPEGGQKNYILKTRSDLKVRAAELAPAAPVPVAAPAAGGPAAADPAAPAAEPAPAVAPVPAVPAPAAEAAK